MILSKDTNGNISYVSTTDGKLPYGYTALTQAEITAYELTRTSSLRKSEIQARLYQIDLESLRPLRAIQNGNSVKADTDKITALETEALALRTELATL